MNPGTIVVIAYGILARAASLDVQAQSKALAHSCRIEFDPPA